MTADTDDLRRRLERLAAPPGADGHAVYRAALQQVLPTQAARAHSTAGARPRSRRAALGVAAAAIAITVGISVAVHDSGDPTPVAVRTRSDSTTASIYRVSSGDVTAVDVMDDRVWIAVDDRGGSSSLMVFDRASGQARGQVQFGRKDQSTRLPGRVIGIAHTASAIWVRVSVTGPPAVPLDGVIGDSDYVVRVDPGRLAQSGDVFPLRNDGPLSTDGDRVAFADSDRLVVATDTDTSSSIAYAGVTGPTPPGSNGVVAIAVSPAGVWALHQGNRLVLSVPAEGADVGASSLAEAIPFTEAAGIVRWIGVDLDGDLIGVGNGSTVVRRSLPGGSQYLGALDGDIVVARNRAVEVLDPSDRSTHIGVAAEATVIGVVGGGPHGWLATATSDDGATLVSLTSLPN